MDIQPGVSPNPNGSPATPGTLFSGPLMAGAVQHSDGTGNLASLAGTTGTANTGYCVMAQSMAVTQAAGGNGAIVIPAQSQILRMMLTVTTAWNGTAAALGIGSSAAATAFTTAGAVNGGTLGNTAISPGTGATQIGNWKNTGTTDVLVTITSTNTGAGVGLLTVEYVQGINNA